MRRGRIAIAGVVVVLLSLIGAGGALACSCMDSTPAESLARADAAIVGRLLAVEPRGPGRAVYRYDVLRVYRGHDAIEPRSTLKVMSSRGSAACGLPERVGSHTGLFLLGRRGHWTGSLCGLIAPRRLRIAAEHSGTARAVGAGSGGCAT